jgi:hypothetical protein
MQIDHPPSEDNPCNYFVVMRVEGNDGFGNVTIGTESEIGGEPYRNDCDFAFGIYNIRMPSKTELTLYAGNTDGQSLERYIDYDLERIE